MAVAAARLPTLLTDDLTAELEGALRQLERVAWDIETSGLEWNNAAIATCQLYAPETGAVVVQLNGTDPHRLQAILEDERVIKVFHHAPFDLRFMVGHWEARPRNIKCTKLASKLLWPDLPAGEHSLASLLERLLAVHIDKEERLSDWLAQDLSDAQVEYAANDVRFLLPLLDDLEQRARNRGLADLLQRCFDHLPTRAELDVRGFGDVYAY